MMKKLHVYHYTSNKWGYLHHRLTVQWRKRWCKGECYGHSWRSLGLNGGSCQLTSLWKELGVNGFKVLLVHHTTWTLLCEMRKKPLVIKQSRINKGMCGNFSLRQTHYCSQLPSGCNLNQIFFFGSFAVFPTLFFSQTYVFEAPVEDLQLLLGELSLLLQLVHAFRAVAHGGELKVIFDAVCVTERPVSVRMYHSASLRWSACCNEDIKLELMIKNKSYTWEKGSPFPLARSKWKLKR